MTTPVDAIGFLPPLLPLPLESVQAGMSGIAGMSGMSGTTGSTGAAGSAFVDWMAREVAATNDKVIEANRLVQRLATGDTSNQHQVMLGIERARLQFQLLVQVRNRVLEAYQDVLRMQV